MKQGLLFIFLLGYGYMAPLSCSKKQAVKQAAPVKHHVKPQPKQVALFGPVPMVRQAAQKA